MKELNERNRGFIFFIFGYFFLLYFFSIRHTQPAWYAQYGHHGRGKWTEKDVGRGGTQEEKERVTEIGQTRVNTRLASIRWLEIPERKGRSRGSSI